MTHLAWLLFSVLACGTGSSGDVPTATVVRGPFAVTLSVPGELKAKNSVTLSAPDLQGQAKVAWVVEEGTRVAEGDELIRFDRTDLENTFAQATDDLETAMTKIDQRRAQLEVRLSDQQTTLTSAELSLKRAELRVTQSESVPRVERESTLIDVKEQTLAVDRAKAALESARLEGQAELELLRLDADRAKRTHEKVQKLLDKATIVAPSPGIVILASPPWGDGPVKVGDSVWRGSPLVELPDLSAMEVLAWVHEVDAAKVKAGQTVTVVIDAHPEPSHAGKVEKVADLAVQREEEQDVKFLKVNIGLDATADVMKPGMTVRSEILVERAEAALAVPLEAVFYDGDVTYVHRQGFGGFGRAEVKLGQRNDTHVVVTEGLEEGDVVALVDPEKAAAGEAPKAGSPSVAPSPSAGEAPAAAAAP